MIVDELNRERFFHGVNVVYKKPPWIPRTDVFTYHDSFAQQDIDSLEEWGLNIIRLGTQWPGAEPTRGVYDYSYIQKLQNIVEAASK